ncbi:cytochrome c oxidase assembly protein [Saccharospirillum sp. HFRX-1]|uniref:cytochrome c oxidase assembly protein n=1 Tax=unclassified Saccharospirillum TaxID=2633430 RepID=UPI0037181FCD
MITDVLNFVLPYELSWLAVVFFGTAAVLYVRGAQALKKAGQGEHPGRQLLFWFGLLLAYTVLHTRFDYYAQFMFFIHRGQHLVLHHLAPILLCLANPWRVLAAGVPKGRTRHLLTRLLQSAPIRWSYAIVQYPLIAGVLFFGLIFFWLEPGIHFRAMLDQQYYLAMNWSMWLEGILFWWLILDPRHPQQARTLGFGKRILLIWFVTIPQLWLGAYIATSREPLFDVYDVCGRAWPIDPMNDQLLGGILTWIPPGMMAVLTMLIVLRRLLHASSRPATA